MNHNIHASKDLNDINKKSTQNIFFNPDVPNKHIYKNMRNLRVTKLSIKSDKLNYSGSCRIVQLSDLHKKSFGTDNIDLINAVKSLKPDMIFITGDMVSRDVVNLSDFKHLISELLKICPVYYCLGNHEKDTEKINPDIYNQMISFLSESDIHLLDNKTEKMTINKIAIKISGITLPTKCYKNNGKYKNLHKITAREISQMIGICDDSFNILLAHNPVFFDTYAEYGADLIFSGHVHGGCVRLPLLGGILSPERKFFPKYTSGIYKKNNSSMIVSRGLGKFRIFNPPEIIFLELY